jgi:hypothetical protein
MTTVPWAPRLTLTETGPSDRHPNADPTKLHVVPVPEGIIVMLSGTSNLP